MTRAERARENRLRNYATERARRRWWAFFAGLFHMIGSDQRWEDGMNAGGFTCGGRTRLERKPWETP